ncbi:MAG: NAD(P)H-dependent oxidoreductase [Sulfurimonadaceae bacterium]|jgi:modulator of drug activity B|nr:NAD(P)H-dependent oxidoreductase [Sulfurimonadaceae bacterium]
MKNVLIINGHQKYEGFAEGKLTKEYINKAADFFNINGFNVKQTVVEDGYSPEEEIKKLLWADAILLQYPVYWMGVPWMTKKYFDDVFTSSQGQLYINDGRSKEDASKKYGSGGLMNGRKYMLSLTYNCPESEFSNKEGFFEGLSLDEANFAVHKIFQFCGAQQLETYAVHDVYKGDMNLEVELSKFEETLKRNFL